MFSQNQFNDYFKNFGDFKAPTLDFNHWFSTQRRNMEAFSAASQVVAEGYQAVLRRMAEITRSQVEQGLRSSRDQFSVTSPEQNLARAVDFGRDVFENNLQNLREISQIAGKFASEAFDLLNKRASENFEEISKTAGAAGTTSRKKAA